MSVGLDSRRLNGLLVHTSHQYLPCSISIVSFVSLKSSDRERSGVRYKSDVKVASVEQFKGHMKSWGIIPYID